MRPCSNERKRETVPQGKREKMRYRNDEGRFIKERGYAYPSKFLCGIKEER